MSFERGYASPVVNAAYGSLADIPIIPALRLLYPPKRTSAGGTQMRARANGHGSVVNDLFGAREQCVLYFDAESRGHSEIDHQLKLRRLLDWQIGWLCTLENLIGETSSSTIKVRKTGPIGQEQPRLRILS